MKTNVGRNAPEGAEPGCRNRMLWSALIAVFAGALGTVRAQTTILQENFEGAFPGAWATGNTGSGATWLDTWSGFGGENPHGGYYKGYCAGTKYGRYSSETNPVYDNNMIAYMSRSISLSGFTAATLSFWYKIPSIESGWDYARVYISEIEGRVLLWSSSLTTPDWTQVTIELDAFVGVLNRTLTFEFTSDGSNTAEGWYLDDIQVVGYGVPANDLCAGAMAVDCCSSYGMNTRGATSTSDPVPTCRAEFGKGVWFKHTVSTYASVTATTYGSGFDTVIQVYRGGCGALIAVACNDDVGTVRQASVTFDAIAGETYYFLVGGYQGVGGPLQFQVLDYERPAVTCPPNVYVQTDPGQCSKANVTYSATATDNCGSPAVEFSPPNGSTFSKGSTQVICTARDAAGNTSTCNFWVVVQDNEKPQVTCPGNIVAYADTGQCSKVVTFAASAMDNCPGVSVSCNPPSGSSFPIGTTTVFCTARDTSENADRCSFTVTIRDAEAPQVSCPAAIVAYTDPGQCSKSNVTFVATATDNCPGVTVSCNPPSGSTFPRGVTTVFCAATDSSGNTSTCSFTVSIRDTEAPRVSCPADIVGYTDPGQCSKVVTFTATATDNCPDVSVSCNPPSGSTFPKGTNIVICTATDSSGNSRSGTFTVTILDGELPQIFCPTSMVVYTDPGRATKSNVIFRASATDNCPSVSVSCTPPSGSTFEKGATSVLCTATDASGNRRTCSFVVKVVDPPPWQTNLVDAWGLRFVKIAGSLDPTMPDISASFEESANSYQVFSAGHDIGDSEDGCAMGYTAFQGDFSLRVRIDSEFGGAALSPGSKAGLMARNSLEPGGAFVFYGTSRADGDALMIWRDVPNDPAGWPGRPDLADGLTLPFYLRLDRSGNTFTGFWSTNGVDWDQGFSRFNTGIVDTCYVGLALSSAEPTNETVMLFSDFAVNRLSPGSLPESETTIRELVSDDTGLSFQASLPELNLIPVRLADGHLYAAVKSPKMFYGAVGKPATPQFKTWILIPNGTTVQLETDIGEGVWLDNISLMPAQPPRSDLENAPTPPFTMDEAVFHANTNYPGLWAEVGPVQIKRGQQCALLTVYPYQYNPVLRRLDLHPDLKVTLRFVGIPEPPDPRLFWDTDDTEKRVMAVNPNLLHQFTAQASKRAIYMGYDYLILTPPEFKQAADALAAWRSQCGFKTMVYSENWSLFSAYDIRAFLYNAYTNWPLPPKYVLLLGDAEHIPCWYWTWHPFNNSNADSQGITGTDLYYALLEGADPLNPFSDLLPEITIGRLPVEQLPFAMDYVDRVYWYEKYPPPSAARFYTNVALCSYFQDIVYKDGKEDSRYVQTAEDLAVFLSQPGYDRNKRVHRLYCTDAGVDPKNWNNNAHMSQPNFAGPAGKPGDPIPAYLRKPAFPWNAQASDIKAAANAGCFLIVHRDHGGRQKWGHPKFDWFDVADLQLHMGYPVVWALNCQSGWFDEETDFPAVMGVNPSNDDGSPRGIKDLTWHSGNECLAEGWLNICQFGGAAGVIAATRVSDSVYNDRLLWGLTDALWPDFVPNYTPQNRWSTRRLGDVLNSGKIYMMSQLPDWKKNDWTLTHVETYECFGDPALPVCTGPPIQFWVALQPNIWALLPQLLKLELRDSGGSTERTPWDHLKQIKITVTGTNGPPESWVGSPDEQGMVTFSNLTTRYVGNYTVTVTGPNCLPLVTNFQSRVGASGGVSFDADWYTCPSEVKLGLADADLAGTGSYTVQVTSSEPPGDVVADLEQVQLTETATPGFFTGSVYTVAGPPVQFDGVLEVKDRQILRVLYHDAANGQGEPATMAATAEIDAEPPEFSGIAQAIGRLGSIRLEWNPASDRNPLITYRVYRAETPGGAPGQFVGSTFLFCFVDTNTVPDHTYYYTVRAADPLGNEDTNTVVGSTAVPVQPIITSVSILAGAIEIRFSAGSGDAASMFKLQAADAVTGTYTDSDTAMVTSVGTGQFKATAVLSGGPARFYRIRR